jgi:hypothetical protein
MITKTMSRMRKTMRRCQRGGEGLRNLPINDGTSDNKGGDKMGNKDAHLHIVDQEGGSHQVTHLALTLTTYWQDWGDVTCTDEQKMGGADDSSWGWL